MVLNEFGGPDVLHMADIDRPRAAPGNVIIQVAYASVNPADWKSREGWLSQYFQYQFPFVVGFDAAGIVAEVGEGVTTLAVGDRVVTASNQGLGERGTYAEYVASAEERCVKLPDTVSLRDAAAMPTAAITAYEAVHDVGAVSTGARVLINGGAGGTGSYAIQLAHQAGARVAATCSPGNADYVKSLGAELAINYREGNVADAVHAWAPEGVDLVVDTVGQGTLVDAVEFTRRGGVITPIATLIADEIHVDPARADTLGVRVVPTMASYLNQPRQLRALVAALVGGKITAPAITVMPLAQAGDAHRQVQDGHVRGKIVLDVNAALDQ
ncbi:NADP-dependent oxidoreductase [Caenibius tardaugens NBRC 16725]|nr:NADP-dependent oxidoreductase [Caenibius tardaugens NBRC 16725]